MPRYDFECAQCHATENDLFMSIAEMTKGRKCPGCRNRMFVVIGRTRAPAIRNFVYRVRKGRGQVQEIHSRRGAIDYLRRRGQHDPDIGCDSLLGDGSAERPETPREREGRWQNYDNLGRKIGAWTD